MTDYSKNLSRIAKNTMMLYVRMFVLLIVSLLTSRLIINSLGIVDYGIYNVIGGVVSMMTILNSSMSATIQRFLNFAEGKNHLILQKKTFSASMLVYIILCIIFLILSETIGLWFVNNKLVIPEERLEAANWIYQCIIFSTSINFLSNPYNAVILARENMKIYAYVSVAEALMKLAVALVLIKISYDKLIVYGFLMLSVSFITTACYRVYCKIKYDEAIMELPIDISLFKRILSFSGWTLFGSGADLAKDQGINILLNLFFNPIVNAARGIALQIIAVINQFFSSFYAAVKPQIVKYYANEEYSSLNKLMIQSGKFSYFLIMLVSIPIIIETPYIINLWLGKVPEYVVVFTRLMILVSAVDALSSPLMTAANATGNIILYQVTLGLLKLLTIPIVYMVLKHGGGPSFALIVSLIISQICLLLRVIIVNYLLPSFSIKDFVNQVLIRSIGVTALAAILPCFVHHIIEDNLLRLFFVLLTSVISTALAVYAVGFSHGEKIMFQSKIKGLLQQTYESHYK